MSKKQYEFNPDYAVPPGETLKETLDWLSLSRQQLAEQTGLKPSTIKRVVEGTEQIDWHIAELLQYATGVPARMWRNLETNYRAAIQAKE